MILDRDINRIVEASGLEDQITANSDPIIRELGGIISSQTNEASQDKVKKLCMLFCNDDLAKYVQDNINTSISEFLLTLDQSIFEGEVLHRELSCIESLTTTTRKDKREHHRLRLDLTKVAELSEERQSILFRFLYNKISVETGGFQSSQYLVSEKNLMDLFFSLTPGVKTNILKRYQCDNASCLREKVARNAIHENASPPGQYGFTYIKSRATEMADREATFYAALQSLSHKAPYSNHEDFMTLVTEKFTHAHDQSLNTFSASDIVFFCVCSANPDHWCVNSNYNVMLTTCEYPDDYDLEHVRIPKTTITLENLLIDVRTEIVEHMKPALETPTVRRPDDTSDKYNRSYMHYYDRLCERHKLTVNVNPDSIDFEQKIIPYLEEQVCRGDVVFETKYESGNDDRSKMFVIYLRKSDSETIHQKRLDLIRDIDSIARDTGAETVDVGEHSSPVTDFTSVRLDHDDCGYISRDCLVQWKKNDGGEDCSIRPMSSSLFSDPEGEDGSDLKGRYSNHIENQNRIAEQYQSELSLKIRPR